MGMRGERVRARQAVGEWSLTIITIGIAIVLIVFGLKLIWFSHRG